MERERFCLVARHDGHYRFRRLFQPTQSRLVGDARIRRRRNQVGLLFEIVHPDDRPFTLEKLAQLTLLGHDKVYFENRCLCKDGSHKWLCWAVTAFRDEQLYYAVARDVSERKMAEERLQHDAFHDTLTGLPNRLLFMDRLRHAIRRGKRSGITLCRAVRGSGSLQNRQ